MSEIPLRATDWTAGDHPLGRALARARGAWRRRVVIGGITVSVAVILAGLLLSVLASAWLRVTPAELGVIRLLFGALVLATIGWWVVRPAVRRVTDATVARYLEEQAPESGQVVLSAVDQAALPAGQLSSPSLARRLADQATAILESHGDGRAFESGRQRRSLLALVGMTSATVLVLGLGPDNWRTLAAGFLAPWTPNESIVPARTLVVTPGDATLPRGASLDLSVRAEGFVASEALLYLRSGDQAEWELVPMAAEPGGQFTLRLFDLDSSFTYQVRAEDVRSAVHRVTITDLPAVQRVDLTLDYPDYVGLPAETISDGGDVAAVVGTVVEVRPTLTMPVGGGMLRFDDGTRIPLALIDSTAPMARFRVQRSGFYSIDLVAPDGTVVPGTVRWAVDALEDRPPIVRVLDPGRDTRATNVEEMPIDVSVDDDYGVRTVSLRVAVNGGAEREIVLAQGLAPGSLTPRLAHTLFLEEFPLVAGDLVAYHAVAVDGAGNEARSDLYFVEIRPFSRNYRQAEEGGAPMPGGGMGGGEQEPELSREQRDLIVATYNVIRDSGATTRQREEQDVAAIATGQERLLERVRELTNEMAVRGAAAMDSTFVDVKQALDSAEVVMDTALTALRAARLDAALPMEQRALQQLQRAEALYRDVQVQMGQQQGGGGGGGGGGTPPEDLADLFELERDQLRNQYEAVQRQSSAAPAAAREVDEVRERLRDLARRLEQENERQRRMAEAMSERLGQAGSNGGAGSASGSSSASAGSSQGNAAQRRLAAEAEEEARRLERLARERNTPELAEAARSARRAADNLRRAAAGERQRGQQALEELRDAAQGVGSGQESRARREAERLGQEAAELAREQQSLTRQAASLPAGSSGDRDATVRRLQQQGARLSGEAGQLLQELDQLSRELRGADPAASTALADGAQRMREFQIPERIAQGSQFIGDERVDPAALERFNQQVGQVLDEVRDRVAQAAGAVGTSPERQQARALERARELVRGMAAMRERTEAAAGEEGTQGGQAQQGEQGNATGQRQSPAGGGDTRQLSGEVRMRLGAAEQLRAELDEQGISVASLDEAIATMRQLQQDRVLGDPLDLARLQAEALESLRQAEYDLWRRFGAGGKEGPAVGELSRVSPRYRALVEEYFRSIAREQP